MSNSYKKERRHINDSGVRITLDDKELEFYSRQIMLTDIGYDGQLRLKRAKVCIVGLGGLGSSIARQLTAMGVGYIRLVDRDIVELSNLQRQSLYDTTVLGYAKAEVAAKRLSVLNPHVTLEASTISITTENAEEVITGMDIVVDGLDAMQPRYAVNRACIKLGIPYIFGAAIMTYGNVSTFIPNKTPCLECFYGNIDDTAVQTCAVVGVHPSVITIIASIEVAEAIRLLIGDEPVLKDRLLYCSLDEFSMDLIDIKKHENCPICSGKFATKSVALRQNIVEEVCGREGKRTFVITPKKTLNLNLPIVFRILKRKGFRLEVQGKLGITVNLGKQKISVLRSGVLVGEGFKNEETCVKIYNEMLDDYRMKLASDTHKVKGNHSR